MRTATNTWNNTLPALHKEKKTLSYASIFWLFLAGSLLGVLLEGIWCKLKYGWWETHVVSLWGPYCILYGFGMAGCYAGAILLKDRGPLSKFLCFALIGNGVEYVCGLVLQYGLHMRAWNYSRYFMNVDGHICLMMTIVWGTIGVLFGLCVPLLEKVLKKMRGKSWTIAAIVLSVLVYFDIFAALVCIERWEDRHAGEPPKNAVERYIDKRYDDEKMAKRFMEWRFINPPPETPPESADETAVSLFGAMHRRTKAEKVFPFGVNDGAYSEYRAAYNGEGAYNAYRAAYTESERAFFRLFAYKNVYDFPQRRQHIV